MPADRTSCVQRLGDGHVTLRMPERAVGQALDIVLRTKGTTRGRQDNVITGLRRRARARRRPDLAARKDVQELEPLRSEYLR